jgi:hypothetical protein
MRKGLAERVVESLLACSGKLDRSVAVLEGSVDQQFYDSYRRRVGQVMGVLYIDILRGLFQEHPGLEPNALKFKDPTHSALTLLLEAHDGLARLQADLDRNLDDEAAGEYIEVIDAAQERVRELITSLESYPPAQEKSDG